jgi:hypothetical protein
VSCDRLRPLPSAVPGLGDDAPGVGGRRARFLDHPRNGKTAACMATAARPGCIGDLEPSFAGKVQLSGLLVQGGLGQFEQGKQADVHLVRGFCRLAHLPA